MFDDYIYADGVSYPSNYVHPGNDNFLVTKSAEPLNPIYQDEIRHLDKRTKANMTYLRSKLIQQDPCYAYDMKHWHKKEVRAPLFSDGYPPDQIPKWEKSGGIFGSGQDLKHRGWSSDAQDAEKDTNNDSASVKICYLCSTLDEHKQHLAKRGPQLKAKPKRKPRVEYIPPPPTVRKKVEEEEEKEECLYKVVVRTGDKPDAGTSANVLIQLHGQKKSRSTKSTSTKKKPLKKKLAVNFCFGRGTSETFHVKGADVGQLKYITIEHDGLEKRHGWFLDEVEITEMSSQQMWVCVCKQWLSLFHGDYSIKRRIPAEERQVPEMEYEIDVYTAKTTMAATDANVFITFHAKKGVSPKYQLRNKSKDNFEKGQKDTFYIITKDLGRLSNIKIEHDNSGACPGWLLEKVVIRELMEPGQTYTFPCGQWLSKSNGDKQICRTLYPLGCDKHGREVILGPKDRSRKNEEPNYKAEQITYEVSMVTGTCRYAGTDATIYVKINGKLGLARELEFKDTNGKRFEKGATDTFKVRGDDVGDIKSILLRHDNTGMAAGWFCESVTIRRFFSKPEVVERLAKQQDDLDEKVNRRASEIMGEDTELIQKRRQSMTYKGSSVSLRDNQDDDNDAVMTRKNRGGSRGSPKRSPLHTISEESEARRHHPKSVKKGNKKKKMTYNGVTTWITDSDDDDDDDDDDDVCEDDHRKRGSHKYVNQRNKDKSVSGGKTYDSDSDGGYRDKKLLKKNKQRPEYCDASSSSSEEEEDYKYLKNRGSYHHGINKQRDNSDEEMTSVYKKDRIPYCDEYVFPCNSWLAEDEGDGLLERRLKPKSVTTFYKMSE